jgi:hypothetical protein
MAWTTSKAREYIKLYKATHPCVDCSDREGRPVFYPVWMVDFDHDPERGAKRITIGHDPEVRRMSEEELLQEISKCEIVCANCHREREYQRQRLRRLMKRTE